MRRFVFGLSACITMAGLAAHAFAQQEPPAAEEPGPAVEEDRPKPPAQPAKAAQGDNAAAQVKSSDVVVVPRKAVLKTGRVEFAPMVGMTINDPLIRH